jgi:heme-degrading monooxygenase HmoA
MYARVTVGKIHPGQSEEVKRIWREELMPLVRRIPGLQQIYVFVDAETTESGVFALYDSEASAQSSQVDDFSQQAMRQLANVIVTESVQRKVCDVFIAETM